MPNFRYEFSYSGPRRATPDSRVEFGVVPVKATSVIGEMVEWVRSGGGGAVRIH